MDKYISIATEKWGTTDKNTNDVIQALTQTRNIIDKAFTDNKEEIAAVTEQIHTKLHEMRVASEIPTALGTDENTENSKALMNDMLPPIVDMFDIGKYVILDKAQIDNAARADIIERLNAINSFFGSDISNNVRGGRKTRNRRHKKKGTRKNYKRGGGWKLRLFFTLATIAVVTAVAVLSGGTAIGAILLVCGIGAIISIGAGSV